MTLDEAIIHAEEVAEINQTIAYNTDDDNWMDIAQCEKCAEEHRQLAEWLKELKQLREQTRWIPVSVSLPKVNGWYQCTVQVLDLVRTMELYYKNGKWIDNRRVNMFDTYDIYGYAMEKEKHKLSYEELKPQFDWTDNVIAWKPLSEPYRAESEGENE